LLTYIGPLDFVSSIFLDFRIAVLTLTYSLVAEVAIETNFSIFLPPNFIFQ